jgi:hypothetical protein
MKEKDGRVDNVHVAVAYTGTDKSDALAFIEEIKKEFNIDTVICDPLSLSVSCHIGPGALAIAVTKAIPDVIE